MFSILRRKFGNPYFAKSSNDRAAFIFMIFGGHLAIWYELFHVLPYYEAKIMEHKSDDDESWGTRPIVYVHYVIAFTLLIGSWSNLYKMLTTKVVVCDITTEQDVASSLHPDSSSLANHLSAAQPFCARCSIYQPPRTHHCPICDVCILRRDHHCWFVGTCVGRSNHRFYLSMITNMFLAALYANIYHFSYAVEMLGHLGWCAPVCLVAPHMCALFGWLSLHQFLVCAITFMALMCVVLFGWMIQIQVVQLWAGQTKYERKIGVRFGNEKGLVSNIEEIMGVKWPVAWLWPWIRSPLPPPRSVPASLNSDVYGRKI